MQLIDDFYDGKRSKDLPLVVNDEARILRGVYASRSGAVVCIDVSEVLPKFLIEFGDGTDELVPLDNLERIKSRPMRKTVLTRTGRGQFVAFLVLLAWLFAYICVCTAVAMVTVVCGAVVAAYFHLGAHYNEDFVVASSAAFAISALLIIRWDSRYGYSRRSAQALVDRFDPAPPTDA